MLSNVRVPTKKGGSVSFFGYTEELKLRNQSDLIKDSVQSTETKQVGSMSIANNLE